MPATVAAGVAQAVIPCRENYPPRHGLCDRERLDSAMNMHTTLAEDIERELDAQVEAWDWARTAGVSADDLRQALRGALPAVELRQAA